ncbi:hypothetical protein [Peribacillus asahii]
MKKTLFNKGKLLGEAFSDQSTRPLVDDSHMRIGGHACWLSTYFSLKK